MCRLYELFRFRINEPFDVLVFGFVNRIAQVEVVPPALLLSEPDVEYQWNTYIARYYRLTR